MNSKTIFSILGLIVVIVAIVLITRGSKDAVNTQDSLDQQTMLEGTQDDSVSPEDLAAQATPATMPPSEKVEPTTQPTAPTTPPPAFPQTGFPETE